MTFYDKLESIWDVNESLVCVGLDPDINKLPKCVADKKYPIFEFNKAIIDATHDIVCSYKPQIAYYAGCSAEDQLEMTFNHIQCYYPEIPIILDSKRSDIGSTSEMYAKEAFDRYKADAVTVNPYMGMDSLKPFLDRSDKGVVVLCRTSNPGGKEIQELKVDGKELYKIIAEYAVTKWNYNKNVLLVVGATYPEELAAVRAIAPETTFLVPGVGVQGGDVQKVIEKGADHAGLGLVINSSRGIIYASSGEDFANAARKATVELRDLINNFR
jgi:orotidine-5'-phosphate decarboxylase